MEAPIRQECPGYPHIRSRELPIKQQVQAPALSTHTTGVGRGATLEMMRRKAQELECQASLCRLRTRALHQGSRSHPQANWKGSRSGPSGSCTWGRSRSRLWKGFEQRGWSQSTPCPGSGAFASTSRESPLPPWSSWVTFAPGTLPTLGERGWKRMPIGLTCTTSLWPWNVTAEEAEALTAPVLRHKERSRCQVAHSVKEDDPLQCFVLLNNLYEEVHRYCLSYLDHYTEWIKPCGWCHKVILEREQLNYCKHLTGVEPPPARMWGGQVSRPSTPTGLLMRLPSGVGPGKPLKRLGPPSWRLLLSTD